MKLFLALCAVVGAFSFGFGGTEQTDENYWCANAGPRQDLILDRTTALFNYTLFPFAKEITESGEYLSDILSETLVGRVNPLGTFKRLVMQQYFYSVAAVKPINEVKVVALVANKNVVSGRVDLIGTRSSLTGSNPLLSGAIRISFIGNFYFNRDNKIEGMDFVLVNAGSAFDNAYATPELKALTIAENCAITQEHCVDNYTAFESLQDCIDYQTEIDFGSYDRANSNSAVCRNLHTNLLAQSPVDVGAMVHCKHVSKEGGDICVDFSYESFYTNDIAVPPC